MYLEMDNHETKHKRSNITFRKFDIVSGCVNVTEPEKSKLRNFWEGLEKLLPSLATISGAVAKIVTLF